MSQSDLLAAELQFSGNEQVLVLNSAADSIVSQVIQDLPRGTITLAEDNIAYMATYTGHSKGNNAIQHRAFHDALLHVDPGTMDVAVMNLFYQPANTWIAYGLQLAMHALRHNGYLYIVGAKDRGILSVAKRMQVLFGNVETLSISKGQRVIRSQKLTEYQAGNIQPDMTVFAEGKLDDGTRLLLNALEVTVTDTALDLGAGAGYIGLHIARLATRGSVTMVDVSLAAVATAQRAIEQSGLQNIRVVASDGIQAIIGQRFDLIATNPPFHHAGLQTLQTAERFIREAARVLRPSGKFYLVANRFLKYEPTLKQCFQDVSEIAGDKRYKVLRAALPV